MNVRKAEEQGLEFTGRYASLYSSRIDSVKEHAKVIRDLGFRAVVVTDSNGKSVYAERKYFIYEELKKMEGLEANYERAKAHLEEKHKMELQIMELEYEAKKELRKRLQEEFRI